MGDFPLVPRIAARERQQQRRLLAVGAILVIALMSMPLWLALQS